MESRSVIPALAAFFFSFALILAGGVGIAAGDGSRNCAFPAVFNFGDSNSDTGDGSMSFKELRLPNGMTVGKKFKRGSDGRLIIDFLAEKLGLPYLNGTLDSIGTSFKCGANFATGGTKISPVLMMPNSVPFHLDVQVSQFLHFKSRTIALYEQSANSGDNALFKSILPEPDIFSRALYTIDIGQNDVAGRFDWSPASTIGNYFYNSVKRLLTAGAKFLWIHNTGPFGCLPWVIRGPCPFPWESCELNEVGCKKAGVERAQQLNKALKETVDKLRSDFPDAAITYVDTYSAKLSLIQNAQAAGFGDPSGFCCGTEKAWCGNRVAANGKSVDHDRGMLTGTACNDPSKYISWDGAHYTEAANKYVANLILDGAFSDNKLPVSEACFKQ